MAFAVGKEASAKAFEGGVVGRIPVQEELEVEEVVGAAGAGFGDGVEFLVDLMENAHDGDGARTGKAEAFEEVLERRGDGFVEGIGVAEFVVADFEVDGEPGFAVVGEFRGERGHEVGGGDAGRGGLSPGGENGVEPAPATPEGVPDGADGGRKVGGAGQVEVAGEAGGGVAVAEFEGASAFDAQGGGEHLADDDVGHEAAEADGIAGGGGEAVDGDVEEASALRGGGRRNHGAAEWMALRRRRTSAAESQPSARARRMAGGRRSGGMAGSAERKASARGWQGRPRRMAAGVGGTRTRRTHGGSVRRTRRETAVRMKGGLTRAKSSMARTLSPWMRAVGPARARASA